MSAPVISPRDSILAGRVWEGLSFQPIATNNPYLWTASGLPIGMQILSSFTFEVADVSANTINIPSHNFVVGQRLQMQSTDTLPAGLPSSTDVRVKTISGDNVTLSLTVGGAAIDITDTGTGTHYIYAPGNFGLCTGTPTTYGFWNVTLKAYNNDGVGEMTFTIGILDATVPQDAATVLKWNLDDDTVTPFYSSSSGSSSTTPAPVLFGRNRDTRVVGVVFTKNGVIVDLPVSLIMIGVKEFEPDAIVLLGNGLVQKLGSGSTALFNTAIDFSNIPEPPSQDVKGVLSNYEDDKGTFFDGLGQLTLLWFYKLDGVNASEIRRSSKDFTVRVERDMIPDSI